MSTDSTMALKKTKPQVNVFFTGLALFSMFFGAGNIVFPLVIGQLAGTKTLFTILGLGLSAVAFPFLGLIAMMLYGGNLSLFLSRLGKWPAFGMLLIFQLAQGPVGCLPRLVTLMHASISPYFPGVSLFIFSLFICLGIFILTFRPKKIVDLLGNFLTPILLIALAILIVFGISNAPQAQPVAEGATHHFMQGMKGGYQTMDLIGSLLFATMILPHLSQGLSSFSAPEAQRILHRRMIGSSIIAATLLMLTYIGLCLIASYHGFSMKGSVAPEALLHAISVKILGPAGGIVASIAIFFACLTTTISLVSVFSGYLREHLCNQKISPAFSLSLTLLVTGAFANLGFSGIAGFIGPVLEVLYPATIVLCILNIAHHLYQVKSIQSPVFFALGFALGGLCLG